MPSLRRALLVALGILAASTALLVVLGLSVRDAALLSGVVLVQGATGAVVWAWVRQSRAEPVVRMSVLELTGMGLAIGPALALLSGVLLNLLVAWSWWWAVPTVVVAGIGAVRRVRGHGAGLPDVDLGGLGAWAFGFVVGLLGLALNLRRYPMSWTGTWDLFHRDMVFFEALGTGVARFGASDSVFMAGAPIRYHWFAYAWSGQLTEATGAAAFASLTRVLPLVVIVGSVALAVSWSRRLSASGWVPYLAALLLAGGGYVGAVNGTILNFDSPSQAMSTLWLMGFVVAVLAMIGADGRKGDPARWSLAGIGAVVVLLAVAMTGGKVSTAVTALGGLGLLALVGLVRRTSWRWQLLVLSGLVVVAVGIAFMLVIAGNASSGDLLVLDLGRRASWVQGLNSSPGPRGVVFGTAALIAAIAARWAGAAWLVGDRTWRWRPDLVLALGMAVVGVAAIALLSQGVNETWFALVASAPLSVLSAVGLGAAWSAVANRRLLIASVLVGLAVTPVIAIPWAHGWPGTYIIRFWAPVTAYLIAVAMVVVGIVAASGTRRRLASGVAAGLTVLVFAAAGGRLLPMLGSAWVAVVGQASSGDVVEPAIGDTIAEPAPAPAPTSAPSASAESASADEQASGSGDAASAEGSASTGVSVLVVQPRDRTGWSEAERDAASWLRANAARDAVVVTNETLSFMVPALTGMRTYMSGAPYQNLYGSAATVGAIPARVDLSLAFTAAPSAQMASSLCADGVRYAWVATDMPHATDWRGVGDIVFENAGVLLVRLTGCGG